MVWWQFKGFKHKNPWISKVARLLLNIAGRTSSSAYGGAQRKSSTQEVDTMRDIATRRLHMISVTDGDGLDPKHKLVILSELAKIGVRVSNPEMLDRVSESFLVEYREAIKTLIALRGGDVEYVPLFLDFPEDVPDDADYFARRIVGYLGSVFRLFDQGTRLENGIIVPEWLFDLRRFGADPVTQFQVPSLWEQAKERLNGRKGDEHVEWLEVELVTAEQMEARLRQWLRNTLYAKSSIKEALHDDIRYLLGAFGAQAVDFDRIEMKENQALLLRLLWQDGRLDAVSSVAKAPTDVLRLFAALTDTDVSLARPIKFPKMSRKQRRAVLSVLERCATLPQELQRYRGLWLELGRYLHPGEYRGKFPATAAAFDALRNGKIQTFDGRTEALLQAGDLNGVLRHLAARPGVLARKVHELLRRFPGRERSVCNSFAAVAPSMTVKSLLVLKSYFASINDDDARTVINKRGKIKVLPNNAKGALSADTLVAIDKILDDALIRSLDQRDSWAGQSVWIDPELATYTVPLAQRAASDGLLAFGRGTRIPAELDKVLRLFVYWKEAKMRTDLDLSVIQFNEEFKYIGHVSYTNLSTDGIVHSGDLQSAPHGAAEFVDITLSALAPNVRYLATQVYRYAGDAFADMECHSGWMVRSKVDSSYKSFDIKTVAQRFDLHGNAGYCVPLVVDLQRQEIVLTDLYMGSRAFYNNVEGSNSDVSLVAREVSRFTTTRPTMKQLAELHCRARLGEQVDHRDADITFGIRDCTFNAGDVETVLAELL